MKNAYKRKNLTDLWAADRRVGMCGLRGVVRVGDKEKFGSLVYFFRIVLVHTTSCCGRISKYAVHQA